MQKLPEQWASRLDTALSLLAHVSDTEHYDETWGVIARLFFWRALYDYRKELLAQSHCEKAALIQSFISEPARLE